MKKILLNLLVLLPFAVSSQNEKQQIENYLTENYNSLGLTLNDVSDWIIESEASSKSTKINNFYIKQRFQGKEIFHSLTNVWMKNGTIVDFKSKFVNNLQNKINATTPVYDLEQSLQKAKMELGVASPTTYIVLEEKENTKYKLSNQNLRPIKAQLLYVLNDKNELRLSWSFLLQIKPNSIWLIFIDAVDGSVIKRVDKMITCDFNCKQHNKSKAFFFKKNLFKPEPQFVFSAVPSSYSVFPYNTESPNHGVRELIINPSNNVASPFGWHDTDAVEGAEFNSTEGNNVFAYEDLLDQDFGESTQSDGSLAFDFPFTGNTAEPTTYLDAAITNLFYMNNIVHDVFYQYGFDEVNGNFQFNNYGNGGDGFDQLLAEAQDGGGINNANMFVPEDGFNPAMQMFLWNRKPVENLITINEPVNFSGTLEGIRSNFRFFNVELPVTPNAITSNLVLYNDGVGDSADACEEALNQTELQGNIAVIMRGSCFNDDKILNVQAAGAIAAIVINTLPGKLYISGFGDGITIPVIGVDQSVGDILLQAIQSGTVNLSLSRPESDFLFNDSDFDNLVITHEYGHGISIRLTGGRFNSDCLINDEQMGEGWSDWFGLMMQMKTGDTGSDRRGIATYLSNQPVDDVGIRNFPYSTDMSINPVTFNMTNVFAIPHGVGSVWASMLWDLTWAYVDKYGFDPNIYSGNGGNNKVLQIVIDALKLQPCFPSFIDGRDAILAADQAITGGQDYCMIWEVFANRGLGVNASSGDTQDAHDQIEDFTRPEPGPNCSLGITPNEIEKRIQLSPNPVNNELTITIKKFFDTASVFVYDVKGSLILQLNEQEFDNNAKTIMLESLNSGMYFLKIASKDFVTTKKFIKK